MSSVLIGFSVFFSIFICYNKTNILKQEDELVKIHESAENYLETILVLSKKLPQVRSIDIATELGFSKPSVSVAMKNLRENGYIIVNEHGHISLTESGCQIANTIYERHTLLCAWLEHIGVSKETAEQDACKMEHVLSPETFSAIKKYISSK